MVDNKIKAKEWFGKADHDFDVVNDIFKGSGHPDVAGVLLQQGIEKYLKGYSEFFCQFDLKRAA